MNLHKIITILLVLIVSFGTSFASNIKEIDWAKFLGELWIIKKQNNDFLYRLNSTITRKETMKIISKLSWENVEDKCDGIFSDVDKNDWGCKYIEFAYKKNLIAKNNNFRPNDLITKTEAIKLVLKTKNIDKTVNTGNWQKDYMLTAFNKWIIDSKYYDYNSNALRWWIFAVTTSVVKKEKEEKIIPKIKNKKISWEAL